MKSPMPSKILQGICQCSKHFLTHWHSELCWVLLCDEPSPPPVTAWTDPSPAQSNAAVPKTDATGREERLQDCRKTLISKVQVSPYLQHELINIQGRLPSQHLVLYLQVCSLVERDGEFSVSWAINSKKGGILHIIWLILWGYLGFCLYC